MKKTLATIFIASSLVVGGAVLLDSKEVAPVVTKVPLTEEQLFAHVDPTTNTVDSVVAISQSTIDKVGGWYINGVLKPKSEWVQTSTEGTVRKNYAGKGFTYDKSIDAFIRPKPSQNAVLNESTAKWDIPVNPCTVTATTTCP